MADTENSVNERLPFSAPELESHWGIDCKATLQTLNKLSNQPDRWRRADQEFKRLINERLNTLQKCAFIHNTKDTGRYSPCINYRLLHQLLKDVKLIVLEANQPFNRNQIRSILATFKNELENNSCTPSRN